MKIREQEKIYQIALSNIQGVGSVLFKTLLERFGSAENIFKNKKISKTPNMSTTIINSIREKNTLLAAEKLFNTHIQKNIEIVCYGETAYPKRLREIPNPPPILYCSNKVQFNLPKVVSIVGTRKATTYGKETVKKIIEQLSSYDVVIISGLAQGIDICAHKAAIKHNLSTIGVSAGGLDNIYPFYHKTTAQQMMKKGGVISEQPVGTKLEKHHFPLRNRIIAGMSDIIIITEGDRKSGALTTVKFGNLYDKDVFAVPGCLGKTSSEGCNELIKKNQAHLLTSIEDIVVSMNWTKSNQNIQKKKKQKPDYSNLTQEENNIIKYLTNLHKPISIEFLSQKTKINEKNITSIMLNLELNNLIETTAGNKYKLKISP